MSALPLKVFIVDDEPLARDRLRRLLGRHEGVTVVGEAEDATQALERLPGAGADVLLLDVQMPGRDGFELLAALDASLGGAPRPFTVFVTAHAASAVRAFDAAASDFLVKPLEAERLARAVERARAALAARAAAPADGGTWRAQLEQQLAALLAPLAPAAYLERFAVTVGRKVVYVRAADVDWIQADGNYARLHAGRQRYLVRVTMQQLETELDPRAFVRIHRSTIVRLDQVRELVMVAPGEYRAVLHDGTQLDVMRTYRSRLPGL